MNVVIRNARASDHAQLAALFDDLDRLHRDSAPWLLHKPDHDPRPLTWLQQRIADPRSAIFVAEAGQCVGLATVRLQDAPSFPVFIPQHSAVIDDLFVHPAWRRKGIAYLLYQNCELWARDRAAAWLETNVYDFNVDAFEFYSTAGFQTAMRKLRKPLGE